MVFYRTGKPANIQTTQLSGTQGTILIVAFVVLFVATIVMATLSKIYGWGESRSDKIKREQREMAFALLASSAL